MTPVHGGPVVALQKAKRRGSTLLELMIVLVVIGVVASVAALAMPNKVVPLDDTPHRIANARTKALRTGRPVTVTIQLNTVFAVATAMPDGSVLADSTAKTERMTGQPIPPRDSTGKAVQQ